MNVWSEKLEENLSNLSAYDDGKKDGEKEGIAIGKEEEKREIVINMYNDHVNIDLISKYVNLSKEEVEKIINSLKK